MRVAHYKSLIIILLILVTGFVTYRWWQGPLLPSYQVISSPLVQTVVASGRVETVSRAQIGSEITGVVLERLVQEGDRVSRGDVLLVLKSDEISAQVRQAEAELKELATTRRPQAEVDLANAKVQLEQAQREAARRKGTELGILSAEEREKSLEAERVARNNLESARIKAAALAKGNVEETKLRERLAALQAQLAKTKIRAEVDGTVLTRNVEPGDLVQPSRHSSPLRWMVRLKFEFPLMNAIYPCSPYNKKPLLLRMLIQIDHFLHRLILLLQVLMHSVAQ